MEKWERRILDWFAARKRRIEQEEREAAELLEELRRACEAPKLSRIKLVFNHHHKGERAMAPVPGAVTLIAAGQVAIASVLGFDQNDKPMPADFVMPGVTYTIDDSTIAELSENADGETATVTALEDGIANVKATVETVDANGDPVTLTDSEVVTVDFTNPPPPPPAKPVLTRIQIAFDVQAPAGAAGSSAPAAGSGTETPEAQATTAAAPLTPNQKLAGVASAGSGAVITEVDPTKEPATT